jgi:hypothetical protein
VRWLKEQSHKAMPTSSLMRRPSCVAGDAVGAPAREKARQNATKPTPRYSWTRVVIDEHA